MLCGIALSVILALLICPGDVAAQVQVNGLFGVRFFLLPHIRPDDCGWSSADVARWLESIGLGSYASRFVEKGVTGCTLFSLTHKSLRVS